MWVLFDAYVSKQDCLKQIKGWYYPLLYLLFPSAICRAADRLKETVAPNQRKDNS